MCPFTTYFPTCEIAIALTNFTKKAFDVAAAFSFLCGIVSFTILLNLLHSLSLLGDLQFSALRRRVGTGDRVTG